MDIQALYDMKSLQYHNKIEKQIETKRAFHYATDILSLIFTKVIKFYYSDINNLSRHVHVALDSILAFIFYKISNMKDAMKIYQANNPILQKLLNNHDFSFSGQFTLEISHDIFNNAFKYTADDFVEIKRDKPEHYKIHSQQTHVLKFLGSTCEIIIGHFHSTHTFHEIPYIEITDPKIYCPLYCDNDLKIWVVELQDNEMLMIIEWPFIDDSSVMFPLNNVFEFLRTNNISNIIDNSRLETGIKKFTLPLLHNIQSQFSNIQVVLEDAPEFENLFTENEYNSNLNFINTSILYVDHRNLTYNTDLFIDKLHRASEEHILIYEPFLYLIFNKNRILKSGGYFDIDDIISSESFLQHEIRMKYQDFDQLVK